MTPILKADLQDLRILYLKTETTKFSKEGFNKFIKDCENSYRLYFDRNNADFKKYGNPKTYSQWVNGQIISLN